MGNTVSFGRNDWGNRPLNVGNMTLTEGQQVDIFLTMDPGGHLDSFLDV